MKKVSLQEFHSMKIENHDAIQHFMLKAQQLADQVSKFAPVEIRVRVDESDNKLFIADALVCLVHPNLQFSIVYSDYQKRFRIWCESINDLRNIGSGARRQFSDKYTQPNAIGVLTTKKIQAWINYYEAIYNDLYLKDQENSDKKKAFLASIEGLSVDWKAKGHSGIIRRNGLAFEFTIDDSYINTSIKIDWGLNHSLTTFLAMADNSINNQLNQFMR